MKHKLVIIDTSVYCVWLGIPEAKNCLDENNKVLTASAINAKIKDLEKKGVKLVLPIAVIIETGNFISQIKHTQKRIEITQIFANHVQECLEGNTPWSAFGVQKVLLENENLTILLAEWEKKIIVQQKNYSLADISIAQVAYFYKEQGFEVEIFTGDWGLSNYSSDFVEQSPNIPLKRRSRKK